MIPGKSSMPREYSCAVRPTDIIATFAPGLIASGVEWMIAGGVAAIVYGEPRLTQDIDIVAALRPADAAALTSQFPESQYYCPPLEVVAEEAARDKAGHFNILHLETDARADVYLAGRNALARRGLNDRRLVEIVGLTVPIAPPEYVILHKLLFRQQGASIRHLHDISAMMRVLGDTVDRRRLRDDAVALGVEKEWNELNALG